MTRKHFAAMAKWIALNTEKGKASEVTAIQMAFDIGHQFNVRFNEDKFINYIDKLRA